MTTEFPEQGIIGSTGLTRMVARCKKCDLICAKSGGR
jgi:hypothetical protein